MGNRRVLVVTAVFLAIGLVGCGGDDDSDGADDDDVSKARVCAGSCQSDDECTEGDIGGAPMPGIDPINFHCQAGQCAFRECSSDEECMAGGAHPHLRCHNVSGRALCVEPCVTDNPECFFGGCFHRDDAGEPYCSFEGCSTNDHCGGAGECDTTSGWCVCQSSDQCDGFTCAP